MKPYQLKKRERLIARNKANARHGMTDTPTWISWKSMIDRCKNKSSPSYIRYGARGIKVCDSWLVFENFLANMGERPPNTSIDRINSNGNYEPDNCRWADRKTQANNRTTKRNRGAYRGNRSGIVGVYWNKETNTWRACKKENGKTVYLGLHKTIELAQEAINAYNCRGR